MRQTIYTDNGAGIVALTQYREAQRWAAGLALVALSAATVATYYGGSAIYTTAAQLATITPLIRPMTVGQQEWIRRQYIEGTPPTLHQVTTWTPEGWLVKFPAQWEKCNKSAECRKYLDAWKGNITRTPEVRQMVTTAQNAGGVFLLFFFFAVLSGSEVRNWRNEEREFVARETMKNAV